MRAAMPVVLGRGIGLSSRDFHMFLVTIPLLQASNLDVRSMNAV
jgi:hypothetical protein